MAAVAEIVFGCAVLLGMGLAIFYDLLSRFPRRIPGRRARRRTVILADVAFWLLATIIVVLWVLKLGVPRLDLGIWIGLILGVYAYYRLVRPGLTILWRGRHGRH